MSVHSISIGLIGLELTDVYVTLGMPEGTLALSLVAHPLSFIDSTIDPLLDSISSSLFDATMLVDKHLSFVLTSIWEGVIIDEYKVWPIAQFWKKVLICLLKSIMLIDTLVYFITLAVFHHILIVIIQIGFEAFSVLHVPVGL